MSKIVIVTYKTKPGAADENERLVKGVYAQLAAEAPGEFHYATFRLGSGVSFLHLGIVDGEVSPLSKLSAFQEFQRGIPERCVEPRHGARVDRRWILPSPRDYRAAHDSNEAGTHGTCRRTRPRRRNLR